MSDGSALTGYRLREGVAFRLQGAGLDVRPRPQDHGSISERLATYGEEGPQSDLKGPGVEGLHIHVRSDRSGLWSRALDDLAADADEAERNEVPILIERRQARGVADAWVLLTVNDLARLLGRLA